MDKRLRKIMSHIYRDAKKNAELYADPDDLVAGANITAFSKVAERHACTWFGLKEMFERGCFGSLFSMHSVHKPDK